MHLGRRLQECLFLLALLFPLAIPGSGANLLTAVFSSAPVVNMCDPGPPATAFTAADPRVSLFLVIENMAPADLVVLEWTTPGGATAQTTRFGAIPAAGGYCYADSLTIEGTSAATATGKWTARVLLNGRQLSAPTFTLTAAPAGPKPVITRGGVVNGADFTPNFAPGILLSIWGTSFAVRTAVAAEIPLPLAIAGTFVEVNANGQFYRAPIFFVSAGQINVQLPFEIGSVTTLQVRVFTANGGSTPEVINLSRSAPRLLTTTMDGRGEAIVVHADYTLVSSASPAKPGEILMAYLTGLGAVTPAADSGWPAGDNGEWGPLNLTVERVIVEVNGKAAAVHYSGLAPTWVGLYQINFQVPDGATGSVALVVKAAGAESQRNVTIRCSGGSSLLGSATIPATGGTLSAGPVSITVPPGAFPAAATLNVQRAAETTAPPANQISAMYSIQGLPDETTGSITITLQSTKSNPDPNRTYVTIEEQGRGGGRMIIKATVQGDRISVVLPRMHQLTPHTQAASTGGGRSAATFVDQMVWAFEADIWSRENFTIYGSDRLSSDGKKVLASQLDSALAWLEAAGFNWKSKRSGPIEVDCTRSFSTSYYGEVRYSLSASAEAHIVLNPSDYEDVPNFPTSHAQNVVAQPLTELVTDLYYPSPRLLSAKDRLAWSWLDSAVSILAYVGSSSYADPMVLPSQHRFGSLLREGLEFHRKSAFEPTPEQLMEIRTHGVGVSGFLNSLRAKDGDWRWLGQIYALRPATSPGAAWLSPMEAMSRVRTSLSAEWLDYCREGQRANFAYMQAWAQERTYKVNDVSRLNYPFQAAVSDLSALPYLVEVSGDWMSYSKLTLSINGSNTVAVIDRLTDAKEWRAHLGVANPSFVIEPFFPKEVAYFLVTVVNTRVSKPPPVSVNAQVSMTMSSQTATIQVTPNGLQFSAIQGGQAPAYQSLSISRSGGSPLNWNASVLSGAWIRFSGSTIGTDGGTVRVGVDITGMASGKYTGTVRITSPSAANNPLDVPISLEVQPSAPPPGAPTWLKDLTKIKLWYQDLPWVTTDATRERSDGPGVVSYYSYQDPSTGALVPTTVLTWNGYGFALDVTYIDKRSVGYTYRFEVSGNLSQDLSVIEAVRFRSTRTYTGTGTPFIQVVEVNVAQFPVTTKFEANGGRGSVSAALFQANPTRYVTAASGSLRYTTGNGVDWNARLDWNRLKLTIATPMWIEFSR